MKNLVNEKLKYNIRPLTIASILVILEVFIYFIQSKDSGSMPALRWLLMIAFIAILMRPYLTINSKNIWDNGFCISFCLGLGLSFLLAWLLSVCNICKFDTILCIVSVLIVGIICNIIPGFRKISDYKWDYIKIEQYIWGFALLALIFQCTFWIIGFNSVLDSGTENYMDYGFMQTMYRQKIVAPFDLWFAKEKLNYYYLGQAAAVFMCRVAFTIPEYGYNLMLCTFWTVSFVASAEIVYYVVFQITKDGYTDKRYSYIVSGIAASVGGIYNACAANGQWVLYGVIGKIFNFGMGNSPDGEYYYWFPDATVYINTEFGDADNGKNEFPAYSAILGDLHAHVINVIFVVVVVALILDYIFCKKNKKKSYVNLILIGVLLGLFKGTNYWDFVIYYVITGAIVVFCDLQTYGFRIKTFINIAIKAAVVTVLSFIVTLPFTLTFKKMASQVMIADVHSPIGKMVVLWGIPFTITIAFIVWMFTGRKKLVITQRSKFGLLAFCLCSLGLVITPEILYIKDIYDETDKRFNTMFKLTYQAFILLGIIIAIAVGLILYNALLKKKEENKITAGFYCVGLIIFIVFISALYTGQAIGDWEGDITNKSARRGISSIESHYGDPEYEYEMSAADIINSDVRELVNIVEVAGDSYTHENALSVMTGACTPVGWYVHEWMWRDNVDIVSEREADVRWFYESGDIDYCMSFIDKYDIDYIFVGPAERQKYYIDTNVLAKLGEVVWNSSVNEEYVEDTYYVEEIIYDDYIEVDDNFIDNVEQDDAYYDTSYYEDIAFEENSEENDDMYFMLIKTKRNP